MSSTDPFPISYADENVGGKTDPFPISYADQNIGGQTDPFPITYEADAGGWVVTVI